MGPGHPLENIPVCLPASDGSLLVRFGDHISIDLNRQVIALFRHLHQANPPWLVNLHPAYCSLLIDFDPRLTKIGRASCRERV